jgi:hypothetical protein
MAEAIGPVLAGGFQVVKAGAYELMFLPDLRNDELQREGKAPVYYWMPNTVRLARENADAGPAKFHMLHFVGVQSSDTTVGVTEGSREVSGGLVAFSTTAAPRAGELEAAQEELLNRFRGNNDKFWGWRTPVAPAFRPMPVVSCETSVSNVSKLPNGAVPSADPPTKAAGPSALRKTRLATSIRNLPSPRTVREGTADPSANLDPWFINLQGQGAGNINLLGENAYSGLMGSMPSALFWASFHGGQGAITVNQLLRMKVWAPLARIYIHGNWEKIYTHFSAAAEAHYWWASADIQVELNNMRQNGTIKVEITMDPTVFGADTAAAEKMQEQLQKRTDMVLNAFMEQAKKAIFDVPPPKVEPAHADSGGGIWGFALAVKYRRDENHLDLHYDETLEMAYIQTAPISGTLNGFVDEIKANPDLEKRYFTTLFLDDVDRKVTRTIKPVCNWAAPSQPGTGDPIAFISCQVGYPDTKGELQWAGHMFQPTDPPDTIFQPAMARKSMADVSNPPDEWQPDTTYIKRKIHCSEPPDDTLYVIRRVEAQEVELDPGPNGTPTNDINLEVRADSAGKLDLGPLMLNVALADATQVVEVTIQPDGKTRDGADRAPARFQWNAKDQDTPRNLYIFTGQLDYIPTYKYQVRVIVKGSLFTKGMEWKGPWVEGKGNGALMIRVPTPEDEGVTVTRHVAAAAGAPPVTTGAAPQPATAPATAPAAAGAPGMPPPTGGKAPARAASREVSGYRTAPPATRGNAKDAPVKGWTTQDPALSRKPVRQE